VSQAASPTTGEVVTFYSYKGGTGRSMLLANVAWILASNERRVLTIDWDLEAPGLHRYFHPFLLDKELAESNGVIDFVTDFALAATTAEEYTVKGGVEQPWFYPYADIAQYATSLQWDFGGGTLDFVGAGKQGPAYSTRINSFQWRDFYERFGGGAFLERMKAVAKERYDYVLIDSRTGVSDTSGICTIQLPDTLVVCFTLNNQSVEGAADVATTVAAKRGDMRIIPVPMRIENAEKDKLDLRRTRARRKFRATLNSADSSDAEYWNAVEVPYVPFYAYEEILATFGDPAGSPVTVLAAAERITDRITDHKVTRAARISDPKRAEALAAYAGTTPPTSGIPAAISGGSVYISYRRTDTAAEAGRLYDALTGALGSDRVVTDLDVINVGADFADAVETAVRSAPVMIALIGRAWLDASTDGDRRLDNPHDFVRRELATALTAPGTRVIPVLVDGARLPRAEELPVELQPLVRRQAIELSTVRWSYDVSRLVASVEVALADATRPIPLADAPSEAAQTAPAWSPTAESAEVIDSLLRGNKLSWWRRLLRWLRGGA
jgi:cellulose biosynthesis protein BcsQ